MTPPAHRLLVAFLAVVAVVIVVGGFFIWTELENSGFGSDGDSKPSGTSYCQSGLQNLRNGMHLYASVFGKNCDLPPHRGESFWKCLAGECGDTAQHPESYFKRAPFSVNRDVLICPKNPKAEPPGTISYRGPTESTLSEMRAALHSGQDLSSSPHPALPLACEKPGHHKNPGGWVLYTDGTTFFRSGAAYEDALRRTE